MLGSAQTRQGRCPLWGLGRSPNKGKDKEKMQVILKEDVKKLGKKGEIVEVQEGYGRNFLIPKGLAAVATKENMNVAKQKQGAKEHADKKAEDEAKLMAAQLEKVSVTIKAKAGEGGKFFGKITAKDVADALKAKNIDVDKKKISLPNVDALGEYEAVIKVHPKITSKIKVVVEEE